MGNSLTGIILSLKADSKTIKLSVDKVLKWIFKPM